MSIVSKICGEENMRAPSKSKYHENKCGMIVEIVFIVEMKIDDCRDESP